MYFMISLCFNVFLFKTYGGISKCGKKSKKLLLTHQKVNTEKTCATKQPEIKTEKCLLTHFTKLSSLKV